MAQEAGVDGDEVLISLWDAGIDYVLKPTDWIHKADVARARKAMGVATRRELGSVEYWQQVFGLTVDDFRSLTVELGIAHLVADSRLPKKAIFRLRSASRTRRVAQPPAEADQRPAVPEPAHPPFTWKVVGHQRVLRFLSIDQVCGIHEALADDFRADADPIAPPGVKDTNLLESAVFRPQTSVGKILKYPTIEMAAAALLHSLVHNHAFHNGNKRTALVSTLVFLDENGLLLTCDEDELFKFVLLLAQHALADGPHNELADRELIAVAEWINENSRLVEMGDRPIPWRRLRQILTEYDCSFETPAAGNRINIERRVVRRGFLGRKRVEAIWTQCFCAGDGSEADKSVVNKIRHDLELDDLHGIDSATFYDHAAASPSEFIVKYRKTLRRLARL